MKSQCRFSFVIALFVALVLAGAALVAEAAAKKVIYFTSGSVPTTPEKAEIAKLTAAAVPKYTVRVRNARKVINHNETTDYVSGAIPPAFRDGGIDSGTPFYNVLDPNGSL